MAKDGGGAFPAATANYVVREGMSLRDYLAAKAMQGGLANANTYSGTDEDKFAAMLSQAAYRIADAMLAERKK